MSLVRDTGRQAESALLDAGIVDDATPYRATRTAPGTPRCPDRYARHSPRAGFGADEFDKVAGLIVDVLSATTPTTTSAGAASKAKYVLADGVADNTKAASAEFSTSTRSTQVSYSTDRSFALPS